MNEFLQLWITGIEEQAARSKNIFEGLTTDQLNEKPEPNKWSIGELVEHLLVTNNNYFGILNPVVESNKGLSNVWLRFFPKLMGKMILKTIQPETTKKYKTMKVFEPKRSELALSVFQEFEDQQMALIELGKKLTNVDLPRTYIKSPVGGMVIYSVEDALTIILNHERRHLAQAEQLKERWAQPS